MFGNYANKNRRWQLPQLNPEESPSLKGFIKLHEDNTPKDQ
jgi:hypothetical protein